MAAFDNSTALYVRGPRLAINGQRLKLKFPVPPSPANKEWVARITLKDLKDASPHWLARASVDYLRAFAACIDH
jgi:hypothetical protein